MTNKLFIGLGVLVAAGIGASSTVLAAGAGASARAHMTTKAKSLAETVALSPRAIRRSLRDRGYNNITFIDRQLPVYKVRACRNGKKFRIRLNRWGDIRKRVRIGRCHSDFRYDDGPRYEGLSFPEIRRKLRNRGYHRIRFTDRRLPGYGARACRNGKRFTLRLNRWGKVKSRERRGWCDDYRSGYDGPRRGYRQPYLRYDGPGFSIRLKNRRH